MNFFDLISMDDDDFFDFISEILPDKEQLGIPTYINIDAFSLKDIKEVININQGDSEGSYFIIPSKTISYSLYEKNDVDNEVTSILKKVRNLSISNVKKEFEYLDNLSDKYPILSKHSYNSENVNYNSFLKKTEKANENNEKESYLSLKEHTKTFESQIVLFNDFKDFVNELIDKSNNSNHILKLKPFTLFFVHQNDYIDFVSFLRFVDKNFKKEEANALIKRFISCDNDGFRYIFPRFS